jgi:hypothetical protein
MKHNSFIDVTGTIILIAIIAVMIAGMTACHNGTWIAQFAATK